MFSFAISFIAIFLLIISAVSDRKKTMIALKIAGKTALNLMPFLLIIIIVIGFLLTFVPGHLIARVIGKNSGFAGVLVSALIGSILLIPHFVTAPLAASLLRQGAGIMAIAAFITTLVMVGTVTLPMEMKTMGRKFAIWRNLLSFGFALFIALIMGLVLK